MQWGLRLLLSLFCDANLQVLSWYEFESYEDYFQAWSS
jgi:hypothetical protein